MSQQLTLPALEHKSAKNPAVYYLDGLGSDASAATMKSCLNTIARHFGRVDLFECNWAMLRRHHCQHFMLSLKNKKRAPATINLYLAALKGVAKEAWSLDLMNHANYLKISTIKSVSFVRLPTGRGLTLHQCKKLLSVCDDGSLRGIRDKAMISVMCGCGLRRAEVVKLQLHNWNPKDLSFMFVGKGNKQRKVYLPPDLLEPILTWIDVRGKGPGAFFARVLNLTKEVDPKLRNMLPSSVYRILQKRAKMAKLDHLSPHDLRRTFATRMLEAGIDVFVLQQAMGHSNLNTTAKYDQRGEKGKLKASKSLRFS